MKQALSLLVLNYLRILARIQLLKNKPTIVGITGSAGKTSARNAIAATLQEPYKIKVSYKANSESGLPINILGMNLNSYSWISWAKVILLAPIKLLTYWPNHKIYIAEMAIDSPFPPKNMSYLLSIFKPDVGVFLNAQPMHSFNFDQLVTTTDPKERRVEVSKLIANEKGKMIVGLPKDGVAILNTDDENVYKFKDLTKAKTISFGKQGQAEIKIKKTVQSLKGTNFILEIAGEEIQLKFEKFILPENYAYTFSSAIACAKYFEIKAKQAANLLVENFKLPPGRSSLIKGINNSYILDSSYNSSAAALKDLLALLNTLAKNKKIALLGDMRELGEETQMEHETAAEQIIKTCDLVVLVGPAMKKYVLPILEKSKIEVHWFVTADLAVEFLKTRLKENDLLLVKGSQNELFLEIAVEQLMAEPEKANELLCRRGEYWDKKRSEWLEKNNQL